MRHERHGCGGKKRKLFPSSCVSVSSTLELSGYPLEKLQPRNENRRVLIGRPFPRTEGKLPGRAGHGVGLPPSLETLDKWLPAKASFAKCLRMEVKVG